MRLLRGGLLNMVMALHRCKHDMLSRRGSNKKWRTSALLIAGSLARRWNFICFRSRRNGEYSDQSFWGIWYTIPLCIILARIGKVDGITLVFNPFFRFTFLFLSRFVQWLLSAFVFEGTRNISGSEFFWGIGGDTDSLCSLVCKKFSRGWKKDELILLILYFNFCTFLFLFLYSLFLSFYRFFWHSLCCDRWKFRIWNNFLEES